MRESQEKGNRQDMKLIEGVLRGVGSAKSLLPITTLLASFSIGWNQDLMVDPFNPLPGTAVQTIALGKDGGMVLSVAHTNDFQKTVSRLVEVFPDGQLNPGFSYITNGKVETLLLRPDGRYLVGGDFDAINGQITGRLVNILPNGSVNEGIQAYIFGGGVRCLALQPDGKILVGGGFTQFQGENRSRLVRLDADDQLDPSFSPIIDGQVNLIVVQPDGAILIAGGFGKVNGISRYRFARLHADGSLDQNFNPQVNNYIHALQVATDGRIYIAGAFSKVGDEIQSYSARLNPDGTLDTTFAPVLDNHVNSIAFQANGELLACGSFNSVNGLPRSRFAKLDIAGDPVAGFELDFDHNLLSVLLQPNGKILLNGYFPTIQGVQRPGFARLSQSVPANENLLMDESTLTFLHEGSSPELNWVNFFHSPDGSAWNLLGNGVQVAGGWQLAVPQMPVGGTFRAYGKGHAANNATWEMEVALGPPAVTIQPADTSQLAGTPAFFRASAVGSEPMEYQWYYEGLPLVDDAKVSGANSGTLFFHEVFGAEAGQYHLVASNPEGTIASESATLTVSEPWIRGQPLPAFAESGQPLTLSLEAVASEPVEFHWLKDGLPVSLTESPELTLQAVSPADTGAYTVVVSNQFGVAASMPFQVTVNGAPLDQGFQADANGYLEAIALQADGKILVGGTFTYIGGVPRRHVARLFPDGNVDESFQVTPAPTSISPYVNSISVQEDGRILVAGRFESINGLPRGRVARLFPTGTVDPEFAPFADGWIFTVLPLKNNKVIIGGSFTTVNGLARSRIARLNEDGSLDETFTAFASDWIQTVVSQPDGKLVVGGYFTFLNGQFRTRIARLNTDGTTDITFNPEANDLVRTIAVQADGKILVGGKFTQLNGQPRNRIGRLNPDGSLDLEFNPLVDYDVESMVVQADGAILIGGRFTTVNGQPVGKLARLNPDGTLDLTVNADVSPNGFVVGIALQPDGNILVGGTYSTISGFNRPGLARLVNPVPTHQVISTTATSILWQRGGAAPEILDCIFSHSPDGNQWTELGAGVRVAGGWELTGNSPPVGGVLRATSRVSGGRDSASTWMISSYKGSPGIVGQPHNLELDFGSAGKFSVIVGGEDEFDYQWYKDGVPLVEGATFAGTTSPTLYITNAAGLDQGNYHVVVQSPHGTATSLDAQLFVNDPIIVRHPAELIRSSGETAMLEGEALGSGNILYYWRKDGVTVAQTAEPRLQLAEITTADAGYYQMVASNKFGTAISEAALVVVNRVTPDLDFNPVPDDVVNVAALMPDGKIVIGGRFTSIAGQLRNRIARLNPDGSLDESFIADANNEVTSIFCQPDGRLLVSGNFTQINGVPRSNLASLHYDGSLDVDFDPSPNGRVYAILLQPDGKMLVGGSFTTLGGQSRTRIGRLHANGEIDPDFNPVIEGWWLPTVNSLALQTDGKILVGGNFGTMNGHARNHIARLNQDGTLDTGFDPDSSGGEVQFLSQTGDGKILAGGGKLMRFHENGDLDPDFNPPSYVAIHSLALQSDGQILIGGTLGLAGEARKGIFRHREDGLLDGNFYPIFDQSSSPVVRGITLQPDGAILVAGGFHGVEGNSQPFLTRLSNTAPASSSLTWDDNAIRLLRGGTGPEVDTVLFEHATTEGEWMALGQGVRITGGWELPYVTELPEGIVRARGSVRSGSYSGNAGWFIEEHSGPPRIYWPPQDSALGFGDELTLSVFAGGNTPFSYQWYRNGIKLTNDARISGSQSARLRIHNVTGADMGSFHVEVSSPEGAALSTPVLVEVIDPLILESPTDQFVEWGEDVTLGVSVVGSPPLDYRWHRSGQILDEATRREVELNQFTWADAGVYQVTVNNSFGSAQSEEAQLAVKVSKAYDSYVAELNGRVHAIGVQPDGRILLAGSFNAVEGQPKSAIVRIFPDGSPDHSFDAGAVTEDLAWINTLLVQSDGRIMVGGKFATIGGLARSGLARLYPDGSPDDSFNAEIGGYLPAFHALWQQPGGELIVGGSFTINNGSEVVRNLARLLPSGEIDVGFSPEPDSAVYALASQSNGTIVLGGIFTTIDGRNRERIARVHADGSLDHSFIASADGSVGAIAVQPDGKIILGGSFNRVNGVFRYYLARLNSNGTLDTGFNPTPMGGGGFQNVSSLMLQTDGKILVGGNFTKIAGVPRMRIARLSPDGSIDPSFTPEVDGSVRAISVLANGEVLIGGDFNTVSGVPRQRFAGFRATFPGYQQLRIEDSTLIWERFGGGPELWRTQFETTMDGVNWVPLGSGARTPSGWQLPQVDIPGQGALRARGFITGDGSNGSSSLLDEYLALGEFSTHSFSLDLEVVDGSSRLRINGQTGVPYQIEYSGTPTQPDSWYTLPPFVLTNSIHQLSEPVSLQTGQRIYRARLKQ